MLEKEKWFYFAGGRSAHDLDGLVECLKEMHNDEFQLHVNGLKNDFANWVGGVFGEVDLADELRRVMERKDTIDILRRHLHRKQKDAEIDVKNATTSLLRELVEQPPLLSDESSKAPDLITADELPDIKIQTQAGTIDHESERNLEEDDLREIADEAKQELFIEGRVVEDTTPPKPPKLEKQQKFLVKELIYGFILGLVFGLMMLGTLFQLRC